MRLAVIVFSFRNVWHYSCPGIQASTIYQNGLFYIIVAFLSINLFVDLLCVICSSRSEPLVISNMFMCFWIFAYMQIRTHCGPVMSPLLLLRLTVLDSH